MDSAHILRSRDSWIHPATSVAHPELGELVQKRKKVPTFTASPSLCGRGCVWWGALGSGGGAVVGDGEAQVLSGINGAEAGVGGAGWGRKGTDKPPQNKKTT